MVQFLNRVTCKEEVRKHRRLQRDFNIYLNLLNYTYLEEDFSDTFLISMCHMHTSWMFCTLLLANTPPSLNQPCHFTTSCPFSRPYITRHPGTRLVKIGFFLGGVGVGEAAGNGGPEKNRGRNEKEGAVI